MRKRWRLNLNIKINCAYIQRRFLREEGYKIKVKKNNLEFFLRQFENSLVYFPFHAAFSLQEFLDDLFV